MKNTLQQILSKRIMVLDGAMGTMLQRHGLSGNSEEFNFTHPDIIQSIHQAYIDAGADMIETNSFSANRISQAEYGCQDKAAQMALEAARIARRAADSAGRKVWVAGSIGPTGKSLSLASDLSQPDFRAVDFDTMAAAYEEQISALVEGGVDILLVETCFDALNTKAAIYAAGRVAPELPMIISVAVSDRSGRTLTGQTLEAFYTAVKHAPLLAFGMNCSFGASELEHLLEELAPALECPVSFYPNAGLPNEMGQYDQTPEVMSAAVDRIAAKGLVNIIGGCCGTTPEHIAELRKVADRHQPRPIPADSRSGLTVSGLECATIDRKQSNFTNIGERTNVAGSRKFARLIASGAYDEALQVGAQQIEGGARIIDINMDDAMLDSQKEMRTFLRHISNDPAVARAALMIDSSNFPTVMEGLKNAQGKCIVNSISLKEGEELFLEHAAQIKALGAAVVVMAFDEEGQATTYQRKIEICERAYRLLTEKLGFNAQDIIFDVNVLSVGTGIAEHARYGVDFIEAVRWIKQNLPGAMTSGGISNLSFAFRGNNPVREAMHSAFLYHATAAGLDMGIVNPSMLQIYDSIDPDLLSRVEDVILNRRPDATERLIELAQSILAAKDSGTEAERKTSGEPGSSRQMMSPAERLTEALVRGNGSGLAEDVLAALQQSGGKAVELIEGPLMAGMEKVGKLFGEGRMFLPQVVKSAKIMKDAVEILTPYIQQEQGSGKETHRPRIVIATVQGDVHDIGKNITAIVLKCNGFDVTDLGVMVPNETIIEESKRLGADIIAVSGLITPSLSRMEELCRRLGDEGMDTPLFIGGATTSALHTAVKLAPLYPHVFYGSDASTSAVMAKRRMMDRKAFEDAEHGQQKKLMDMYSRRDDASAKDRQAKTVSPFTAPLLDDIPCRELGIDELLPFFDWKMFYAVWGFKYADSKCEESLELKKDGLQLLESMKGNCSIRIAARFLEAEVEDDVIVTPEASFPIMRQESGSRLSLADYAAGQIGIFAVSVHREHHKHGCDCEACRSAEYEPMLDHSIRVTLAEAASSWLDNQLRCQLPANVRIVKPAAGYSSCPDHTLKRDIIPLLPGSEKLQIKFTESYAMIPDASICGFIFTHPEASYPEIHKFSDASIEHYASLRKFNAEEINLFLGHLK